VLGLAALANPRRGADYLQDWKRRGPDGVTIHGWVYQLEDGTIRDVNVSQGPPGQVIGKKADVW
jgi:carbonic anhydrase